MEAITGRVRGIEVGRAVRYSAVSFVGVLVTQALLVGGQVGVGLAPVVANVAAVCTAAVPVFVLNRAWVWELRGSASIRREVVPFWALTLVGLGLSTTAVWMVASVSSWPAATAAANLGAFGALWVVKFFVLDELVFAPPACEPQPAVLRAR